MLSYIFFLYSPQAVDWWQAIEWRHEKHPFCGVSCSWASSADELLFEWNASATICFQTARHTTALNPPWRRPLSYRNQSIELWSKSMDWFPYGNRLRHERANMPNHLTSTANTMLKQRHRWKLKTFNMSPFKPYALCKYALHTLLIYENTSSVCKKEILILQKLRRKYFCRCFAIKLPLCKKASVFGVFWSVFSRIRTDYGPEKLRIRTLFTKCTMV